VSRLWNGASLPDDVRELGEAAREFVERRVLPHEAEIVATGVVPDPVVKEVRELGYTGLVIPQEFGGLGVSYLGYCAILEQLSRAPKPVWLPVSVANGVAARMLEHSATPAQRERYLPGIASGELLPAIAVTEPDAGSDVQGLRSRARRVEAGWRIDGTKHYITHGARADVLFVLARTDDDTGGRRRFTQFLVDKGTPGLAVARLQDTMAGGRPEQAELVFDGCVVGDEQVLGGEGQGLRCVLRTFAEERISMAITALGTAQRALELACDYARNRTAFGSAIGSYQAIQIALADSATELVAARAMTYGLAGELVHRPVERAEAAMVKLYASEMAGRVADRAVQIFGGFGYMAVAPVAQIYRDVRVMRISGGTSEIQRVIIAEALLEENA
jgi:alkylation response protein AidB-like acyl-CoA dehydrogenase